MRSASLRLAASLAAALTLLVPHATVAADKAEPGSCNVTTGGISSGGNTVTCNFGLTPEQLKETIEAAVNGRLIDRIVDISKTLGVTEDAAKTLLKIVGEDSNIPEDKLGAALSRVAGDYERLQAQVAALNPDNPTAKALVEQAKPEIEAGHFQHAHELLRQATQAQIAAAQEAERLEQQAHTARDAQMLGAASSTAAEAEVALTERHYTEAAELFGQAADYVPNGHASERGGYLQRQGDALYLQGDERGDNDALKSSIEVYGRALAEYPRSGSPLDWAETQDQLGRVLAMLGDRESGTARLEAAVAAFRAALEERTRDRVPLLWASTQMNLGDALVRLGERDSGPQHLDEAVTAFRAALEELTRERVPLEWAQAQMGLGNVFVTLYEPEKAALAYRAALQEYARARERVPFFWARAQTGLGIALLRLGDRESGTASFGAAVAAFRAALEELTRERVPLEWAGVEANLGLALDKLGEREIGTARLEEAVAAYRAALLEYTRDRATLQWAATTGNQGVAMWDIAVRTSDRALAEAAVRQLEVAEETLRSGGQEPWAEYFESLLAGARAARDLLVGRSAECNAVNCDSPVPPPKP